MANLSDILTARSSQGPSDNFKNLIINGAMQVAQRGTSATSLTSGSYPTVDRFLLGISTMGTWTMTQENDAPTGSGFRNSAKVLCTTADASPAASDEIFLDHRIEGQNLQVIKKGTAAAEQLTLSFWVKSNVTGTYIATLRDVDNTRQVSKSYTISTSATWEKKTITFPADTTGALDNDNAWSLAVRFWLGVGSNFTSGTLATSWESTTTGNTAVGQVNLASATNNYWQITGVQLEVGDTATPFEFKPFAQDLRECQRYYYRNAATSVYSLMGTVLPAGATTGIDASIPLPVTMRVKPTSVEYSGVGLGDIVSSILTPSAITISSNINGLNIAGLNATVVGATTYRSYVLLANNNITAYVGVSAEL